MMIDKLRPLSRALAAPVLALALLSSIPAAAQDQRAPGWVADAKTGCKVWNRYPNGPDAVSWSGACTNGLANGPGIAEWSKDGKHVGRYEGALRDGKRQGRGTLIAANGNRYDGDYVDDARSGKGVQQLAHGARYEGDFRDDKYDGRGIYIDSTGTRYEGEFRNGKREGRGVKTMTGSVNGSYSGEWRNDNYDGQGILIFVNAFRYEGSFRNGKQDGYGAMVREKRWGGGRYEGEWKDGTPHGKGTYTSEDGRIYAGQWTKGCFRDGTRTVPFSTLSECGTN